jgi:hypothetical protein
VLLHHVRYDLAELGERTVAQQLPRHLHHGVRRLLVHWHVAVSNSLLNVRIHILWKRINQDIPAVFLRLSCHTLAGNARQLAERVLGHTLPKRCKRELRNDSCDGLRNGLISTAVTMLNTYWLNRNTVTGTHFAVAFGEYAFEFAFHQFRPSRKGTQIVVEPQCRHPFRYLLRLTFQQHLR